MRKHILSLVACAVAAAGMLSQAQEKKLQVVLKNGNTVEYNMTEIDYLSFTSSTVTPPSDEKTAYLVAIPTDFSSCRVQKVMANGKQVAEIDNEYVRTKGKVLTIVYPMGENGKADLSKGVNVADGGSVEWKTAADTAAIKAGTVAELKEIYVVDGALSLTCPDGYTTANATVSPDLLVDARGSEVNSYKIIKIGVNYWMAENLRAKKYKNGTDITCYTGTQGTEWNADTIGAYHIWADNSDLLSVYGCLYSGYAVRNEAGLAPEGWSVPTTSQWTKLRTAASKKPAYLKVNDSVFWGEGYEGTNETGFSAYPCGLYYYASGTGGDSNENEGWWWSSTYYFDNYFKAYDLDYARITATGTSMVISSSTLGGHILSYGQSVRCIRD